VTQAVRRRFDHRVAVAAEVKEPRGQLFVRQFRAATDVVDLTGATAFEDGENPATVVVHEEPVTDVLAVAVEGTFTPSKRFVTNSGITFSGNWRGP